MDAIKLEIREPTQGLASRRITVAQAEYLRSSCELAAFFQSLPGFALTGDTIAEAIRQLEAGWLRSVDYLVTWKRSGDLFGDIPFVIIDVLSATNDARSSHDIPCAVPVLEGCRTLRVTLGERDRFCWRDLLGDFLKKCDKARLPGDPYLPDRNILVDCADGFATGIVASSKCRINWERQRDDPTRCSTLVVVSVRPYESVCIETPADDEITGTDSGYY